MSLPPWFDSIRKVDALIADLNGIFRGKRLPASDMEKVLEHGLQLPGTIFNTDITGATVDLEHRGILVGDPDLLCRPVLSSLCPTPWSSGTAQVFMSMSELDGRPYFGDPRQRLNAVLEGLKAEGLYPVVALELEFYLTEYRGEAVSPAMPHSPSSGEREWGIQVYGMNELWDFAEVLDEIAAYCEIQGVPASAASSEYAPGQFEINLNHTNDVAGACDQALKLKSIVRQAAQKFGYTASFMPKPFADQAGNGCHVHMSLLDAEGRNLFSAPEESGSTALKHAIGGLLDTMTDATAIFAPGANAYRRLVRGAFAPVQKTWDVNNRTVAVRIPASDAEARRLEHRVAGADVNPYLLCACVLGGIQYGMRNRIEPPARVAGNAYRQDHEEIPDNWHEALSAFQISDFYRGLLGGDFVDLYTAVKSHEKQLFENIITPTEYLWYLRRS